jgi:ribonuclease J
MLMAEPELLFVPLGGAGEIGMNLSLYGYGDDWLMIDCGVTFSDDRYPGLDVFVPDVSFVKEKVKKLHGIVVTHAHEDHIGGISHLWRFLKCPVYVTPFASGHLRRKLSESGLLGRVPVIEIEPAGSEKIGPFSFEFISVAHSIPETQAVSLKTPRGTVLHITDWKLDSQPLVGPVTDKRALQALGREGVIAMMCDSTNIQVSGWSGSEGPLRKSLIEIVGSCSKRVLIACFASNITRLLTCVEAAERAGRTVGLVGRSLWNMVENARRCGYLDGVRDFLPPEEIGYLPRDRVLLIATGSQGESRAALSRIAADSHRDIVVEKGDTVIFSSKEIPGNERAIGRIQNQLSRQGVNVITERDAFVHVSGHPARDEVSQLYDWVKPPLLIPIHGETRHLSEHVKFALSSGIPNSILVQNGSVLRLSPGLPQIIDEVPVGRYAVDGASLLPVDSPVLKTRRRLSTGGMVAVSLVLNGQNGLIKEPEISLLGVGEDAEDETNDLVDDLLDEIRHSLGSLRRSPKNSDVIIKEAASKAIRVVLKDKRYTRPTINIHVFRL